MNKRINKIAFFLLLIIGLISCKIEQPSNRAPQCKQKGTVEYLPMFCGTPPVVYETGIKDLDGNFYRVKNDLNGGFTNYKLGDTIRFTFEKEENNDPLVQFAGNLTCSQFLSRAPISNQGKMIMLQVDHETYNFEGGYDYQFHHTGNNTDSIPVTMYYNAPGDFGGVALYYAPTGETMFSGTIIWMGKGKRDFPTQLNGPSSYKQGSSTNIPNNIQIITHPRETKPTYPNNKIWSAISSLKVVNDYMAKSAKVAIYKYAPSVGIGDPKDWDYLVFLYYTDNI